HRERLVARTRRGGAVGDVLDERAAGRDHGARGGRAGGAPRRGEGAGGADRLTAGAGVGELHAGGNRHAGRLVGEGHRGGRGGEAGLDPGAGEREADGARVGGDGDDAAGRPGGGG